MRKLASIQKVESIVPIDGADRIELVHVLGWQCVVNKGQFQPMDVGVYFEIDSFLPIRPESKSLAQKEKAFSCKERCISQLSSEGDFVGGRLEV